jgi:hypothetical protein
VVQFAVLDAAVVGGLDLGIQAEQVLFAGREEIDARSLENSALGGLAGGAGAAAAHSGVRGIRALAVAGDEVTSPAGSARSAAGPRSKLSSGRSRKPFRVTGLGISPPSPRTACSPPRSLAGGDAGLLQRFAAGPYGQLGSGHLGHGGGLLSGAVGVVGSDFAGCERNGDRRECADVTPDAVEV